uniref:Uncharacterized protein n=1 Tax=Parascaris equorum TaxID=6256 RepID=A0A914RND3_PAREQ
MDVAQVTPTRLQQITEMTLANGTTAHRSPLGIVPIIMCARNGLHIN